MAAAKKKVEVEKKVTVKKVSFNLPKAAKALMLGMTPAAKRILVDMYRDYVKKDPKFFIIK